MLSKHQCVSNSEMYNQDLEMKVSNESRQEKNPSDWETINEL